MKPGEVTTAVSAAHAKADSRSTQTTSRSTAADARPVGAGSDFVPLVDMIQWLGQVERQFGLVPGDMQAASSRTDQLAASISGIQGSVLTCAAQSVPHEYRASTARGEPGRSE